MKTIYTSNYARKGGDPKAAAISKKPPNWYKGYHFQLLAPTWDMIMDHKAGMSDREYTEKYIALLEERKIDPQELADAIPNGTFLLCFEKPTDFCHRHILASWIMEAVNGYHNPTIEVIEWKNQKEVEESKQQYLVDSLLGF